MTDMTDERYYIGVDVGTGSARAVLVKRDGSVLASSTRDTITYRDPEDHRIFEQSTTDIWNGICKAVKEVLAQSRVSPLAVKGVGFDATCSLAVTDQSGEPVVVTKGDLLGQFGDRNIILWADHRAEDEADLITQTGSVVLKYVGGKMSLEMEIPKVLWLKKRMRPELFSRCQFFDLPDYLTYRCTNDVTRSCCSITCKCSYVPNSGWQADFFSQIGLDDFARNGFRQMGGGDGKVLNAGMPVGNGICARAAAELGLSEGTAVGSGVIDAYAGWLGTVAARFKENDKISQERPSLDESSHRLAAVAGTSTCHLVQSPKGVFVDGVWGPYKDAVFQGWWMNEGGQSATGQLIDFMLTTHPAYPDLVKLAKERNKNIHTVLEELLERLRIEKGAESLTELTKNLHFYPDLHGNRSPIADARMKGSFVGLELDASLTDLAKKYHVTLQSIALQNRHIVDVLNERGHAIRTLYISGGQARNRLLMRLFADTCAMGVVLPGGELSVVVGAAMLGRFADEVKSGRVRSGEDQGEALWEIMVEMTPSGTLILPSATPREKKLLEAKYKIFRESIDIQKRWREEMEFASQ